MLKRLWLIAVIALGAVALFGGSAFAAAVTTVKTQAHSTQVDVLFEGSASTTYYLYRYTKAAKDTRLFSKIGSVTLDGSGNVSTSTYEAGDSWTTVQPDINSPKYVAYKDTGLKDGEEYYYFVDDVDQGASTSAIDSETVVSAFPPTQTRHGSYTEFTGACTGCHGLHSAKSSQKLLKGPTVADLCGTCHDGTGSKYNEVAGTVQLSATQTNGGGAVTVPLPAGPFGEQLKTGGGNVASSVHNIYRANGPQYAKVWQAPGSGFRSGNQPSSSASSYGSGTDFSPIGWGNLLSCISCHEPHNRPKNFRLLRNDINDHKSGDGDATNLPIRGVSMIDVDGVAKGSALWASYYTSAEGTDAKMRYAQTQYFSGTAKFCSQCHRAFYNKSVRTIDSRVLNSMFTVAGVTVDATKTAIRNYFSQVEALFQNSVPASSAVSAIAVPTEVTSNCRNCHGIKYQASDGDVIVTTPLSGTWYVYGGWSTGGGGSSNLRDMNMDTAAGAALAGLMGAGHRHPTQVPAQNVRISGKVVEQASTDLLTQQAQSRLLDGPVNIGVPLEGQYAGAATSSVTDTDYTRNDVVCLTCHMAHGSRLDPNDANWSTWYVGDRRMETAYDQATITGTVYGLNGLAYDSGTSSYYADYNNNGQKDSGEPSVTQAVSGYYIVSSDANGDGVLDGADKQYGVSTVLARFNPMASVCYRCHSAK